jgi:zinc transport system permease protein
MITGAVRVLIMGEFLTAILDPDNDFLRLALYVATLASIAFGIIGSYVVTRRISYLAGAISHCVFGGIGAGLFLQKKVGLLWFDPMYGAVASAIFAAVIIGIFSMYAHQREDTVIGALWAVGMALGLLFLDLTPGYFDMMSYLFGDILLISFTDLKLVFWLDIIILFLSIYFYNNFLAVCFDDEFARLRGVPVGVFYILLLCLTALTIVLLVRIVGIIMVIALLTIPAAVAGHFAKKLWHMMVFAVFFCLMFNWTGIAVSYSLNLSSGPTIIMIAGITYLTVFLCTRLLKQRNR